MGYKDITAGEKVAKPLAMRLIEAGTGTKGVEVAFSFIEPSTKTEERLTWIGWLGSNISKAGKSTTTHTMETLVQVLGYNGDETTDASSIFSHPEVLNFNQEVKLVVEMESYEKDGEQKQAPKIRYVNALGGGQFAGVAPESVKNDLSALGFKSTFLAVKQGHQQSKAPISQPAANSKRLPF